MREFAAFNNLQDSALVEAGVALAKFVAAAKHPQNSSFGDAYVASGMDKLAPAALMAVMARIGVETTGAYFTAVREAYGMHQNAPGSDAMQETADRLLHLSGKTQSTQQRLADQMAAHITAAVAREKEGKQ